ncbi:MAG: hypothetical protein SF162_01275 [bacterium]|nr:hypothetical protein [bacterium]
MVNHQQYEDRVRALAHTLDALTNDIVATDEMDINEMLGAFDGRIMAIRDTWRELKHLIGLGVNDKPFGQDE